MKLMESNIFQGLCVATFTFCGDVFVHALARQTLCMCVVGPCVGGAAGEGGGCGAECRICLFFG